MASLKRNAGVAARGIALVGLAGIGALGQRVTAGAELPLSSASEVHAVIDGRQVPIEVGAVVGQVRKEGDRCVMDRPVGVGGSAYGDAPLHSIRWGFDNECRMVIKAVTPVTGERRDLPRAGATPEVTR